MHPDISGIYAATITPRHVNGKVDVSSLLAVLRFLKGRGVASFALNGATGEYCLTEPGHLRTILETVIDAGVNPARVLCGVGGPGAAQSIEFAAIAAEFGVQGLLLPMPGFFAYQQDDLALFARTVADSTSLPVLLYNLPQFTNGMEKEIVASLVAEVSNIVGIKDSSGSLDILRYLQQSGINAVKLVGNDSVLVEAMEEGLCDGVVSGVACAVPEVIQSLMAANGSELRVQAELLQEFIQHLDVFPTPWGIKFALQARGVLDPVFSLPVTSRRVEQSRHFTEWLKPWLPRAIAVKEPALH